MSSEKEKMLAGELYLADEEELVSLRKKAKQLCFEFNHLEPSSPKAQDLLKELFPSSGRNIHMEADIHVDYGCFTTIGENFFANYHCTILDVYPVTIGKNCLFGPNVSLFTATHPLDAELRRSGLEYGKEIVIGDDCWLGGGVIVNPGVHLGNRVVVASGSVITKSFGDDVVLAGNPAKVIKEL